MAAHLTDEQKKKIIADYTENGSYRATAKMNNVSAPTVKKVVNADAETLQKFAQKKKQNTLDMLAYMESRKEQAKEILDTYLETLKDPEKIAAAKLSEVATTMGIVIDKFVNNPLKHQLDKQKLEIELLKLESQVKDDQPEEDAEDNFLDALNGTAAEVWKECEGDIKAR
ncbi:MAG: hypothetical protein K2N44_18290 [Lachnospiraceae bacterium]|nr:hypothetical protein [Lachnospiraceae bacterium]